MTLVLRKPLEVAGILDGGEPQVMKGEMPAALARNQLTAKRGAAFIAAYNPDGPNF